MGSSLSSPPFAWEALSLCSQSDPEAWFPEKGGSTDAAKRICRRCPVRPECYDLAMAQDALGQTGVQGGFSERERRKHKVLGITCWADIDRGILM